MKEPKSYIRSEVQSATEIRSSKDSRYICRVYHTGDDYPELIRVIKNAIDKFYEEKTH